MPLLSTFQTNTTITLIYFLVKLEPRFENYLRNISVKNFLFFSVTPSQRTWQPLAASVQASKRRQRRRRRRCRSRPNLTSPSRWTSPAARPLAAQRRPEVRLRVTPTSLTASRSSEPLVKVWNPELWIGVFQWSTISVILIIRIIIIIAKLIRN